MKQIQKFMNPKHIKANPVWSPFRRLGTFVLMLFICFAANAQNKVITGTILAADDGQPLIGATVVEKGTTNATITDVDGKYKLTLKGDKPSIVITYVGYLNETIEVGAQSNIEVKLVQDLKSIDEVVVVGYGTQTKGKLTGAVSQIKGDELLKGRSPNLSSSLSGRIPGVVVVSGSGTPGNDASKIRIRGVGTMKQSWRTKPDGTSELVDNNDPLIVIDGIPQGTDDHPLDRLDPSDIESMSVLKDASAAIYGAQAANGVILVTTKKGTGTSSSFSYSYNQGYTQPAVKPVLANSYELATYYNDYNKEKSKTGKPQYTPEQMEILKTGGDPRRDLANTDWWDVAIRTWAPISRHNLSAQGGAEKIKYFFSGGMLDQKGIFRNSSTGFSQKNYRSNVDVQLTKYIKIGVNLSGRFENTKASNIASEQDAWSTVILTDPMFTPEYGPGQTRRGKYFPGWSPATVGTDLGGIKNKDGEVFSNIFNLKIDLPFIKGLSVDGYASVDKTSSFERSTQKPFPVYERNNLKDSVYIVQGGTVSNISIEESYSRQSSTTFNSKINFVRQIGKNNINAFLGFESNYVKGSNSYAKRLNFLDENANLGLGSESGQVGSGSLWEGARLNAISRVSYDYDSKYLLEFNFRADASQNFPKGNRTGYYPGISAAWRLSEEPFVKNNYKFIDNLKLRASWGQLGNDKVDAYQYLKLYRLGGGNGYIFGIDNITSSYELVTDPNPNITWEVANNTNFGVNASLFNKLLEFDVDYFFSKRSNILIGSGDIKSVANFAGMRIPDQNYGKMNNHGFEISVTHTNTIGGFNYSLNGNYTFSRSKVIYMGEAPGVLPTQKQEGAPFGSELYYETDGLYTKQDSINNYPKVVPKILPGDIKFVNTNNDDVIDAKDRIMNTKPTKYPEIVYGFSLNASFKGFDMSVLFQGAGNIYKYLSLQNVVEKHGNYFKEVITGAYSETNLSGKYPKAYMASYPSDTKNTFQLHNASYLRCKSFEIGYTLPSQLTDRVKISKWRFYANGSNLFFVINKLGYADPEMTSEIAAYYPQQRILNFGTSLNF